MRRVPYPRPVREASSRIDLDFRPQSYWRQPQPATARMNGTVERWLYAAPTDSGTGLQPGRLDEPEAVDEPMFFGSSPSAMMSGMHLPALLPAEVEIARVTYTQTIHCEVTSVRAQRRKNGIQYRIVNEYETKIECTPRLTTEPLSLAELIELMEDATGDMNPEGLYFGDLQNFMETCEMRIKELDGWICVSSTYYRDLARWYQQAFRGWAAQVAVEEARVWGVFDEE